MFYIHKLSLGYRTVTAPAATAWAGSSPSETCLSESAKTAPAACKEEDSQAQMLQASKQYLDLTDPATQETATSCCRNKDKQHATHRNTVTTVVRSCARQTVQRKTAGLRDWIETQAMAC